MSRKILAAVLAAAVVLSGGLPAAADEILHDSDVLTAGTQTSAVNLTAMPGQVQNVPIDLFISCKNKAHIAGSVAVSLSATASTIPAGGSLTSAGATILKPASWPTDGTACPTTNPVTAPARVVLSVMAPSINGTYEYRTRWTTNDTDAMNGVSDASVVINLTVAPAAPSDTTPPVITKTVTGTTGLNGWFTDNVTVAWSVTDAQSAVVIDSGCGVQNFVNETTAGSSSCQAHSAGGSASDFTSFKIDKTGPSATLSPAGILGQSGWYTSNVTLAATGQDGVSGGVTCAAVQSQTIETAGATFNASCTNAAGLSTAAAPVTVKVDKTGPTATLTVTAGTAGTNGWYTNNVTVSASGADELSGGVTCSAAQTLGTDTSGTAVNGSCTNAAGLATNAVPLTVKLDKSNPSANLTVTAGTLGTGGWYTDDVTLHAAGADNVSNPTTCTADQFQTVDTIGNQFTAECTNDAGRAEAATPVSVKRDATAPVASLEVVSGTPGTNGWFTSGVTVRTVGQDEISGVTCSADTLLDAETAGTTVTGYCVNGAGKRTDAAPLVVKIDTTGPTAIAGVTAGTLGNEGWRTSDVTVTTTGSDGVSGVVVCDGAQMQSVETTGTDFTGTCTNAAGLSTVSDAVRVKLDKTGPSAALTPSGTLGLNGWFTSAVTVSASGQDAISDRVACSDHQLQTSETAGATFNGSCTNAAGLRTAAAALTVKVDTTGPVATLSITAGTPITGSWYTSDVTVHADGSDDLSTPVTCSRDQQLTTDTPGTAVNGSCTNAAGLSTDAAVLTVKLDKSNPTANLSITGGTLGSNGWYTDDVTVHTSGADNVSNPTTCSADQFQTTDTKAQVFNGSCTNDANLSQAAAPLTVKRDASPPTARLVVSGNSGANGWFTSAVTVTVEGEDAISGVTCIGGAAIVTETQGITVEGVCTNGAGERTEATPVTIKVDKTEPTAALAVVAGTSGDNGWYTSDVTVTTSGTESISGPAVCTGSQKQTTETAGTFFNGTCTNKAGLTGSAPALNVRLDKSAPTTKLAVTAGTAGKNGWYTSDVTVGTAGTDPVSGIASCAASQSQSEETDGQTLSGTCRNNAGLVSGDELTVKVDKSGPSAKLSRAGQTGTNDWFTGDVSVNTSGSDTVSSPVVCTADAMQNAETMGKTFAGSCTNHAGLSTSATPVVVKLDKTAPSASLTPDGDLGSNGWYLGDVTVTASGADSISSPVGCDAAKTLNTDTVGTEVTGSCTNHAGLTKAAAPITIKLDTSNPTANLSVAVGTLGDNGWYVDDVTVRTSGADNVSDPTVCTPDQFQKVDSIGQLFNGSCTNDAGRTEQATALTVKRDASAPTASLSVISGTVGADGWYTSAVTVRASGADDQSGVSCTADVNLIDNTKGTVVTGSCTNAAGLTTQAVTLTVKIDTTAPTAALAVATGTAGNNGWYTSDVTVGTSGVDSISGTTCTAAQALTTETTGQAFAGSCTNGAGLTTQAAPLTVKLDKSAPSAALAVTGGTTGSNGWYISNVTVSTMGVDPVSAPVSCTNPQTVSGDSTGTEVNGSCTNAAGLTRDAALMTIKLDKTAPVVTVTNLNASYAVGAVPTPGCTTTDATSGLATQATASVPVLTGVGVYNVTCGGAADNAGNAGSATATLRSIYRWDGFLQPINDTAHQVDIATSIFKAGSTVPVKFQLKRADGTIITPTTAPVWLTPVKGSATTASVDESVYSTTATSGGTYRYDATAQQWIYNWSTRGLAAGFYYRIGVKLDDGQTYYVNIGLR